MKRLKHSIMFLLALVALLGALIMLACIAIGRAFKWLCDIANDISNEKQEPFT